jgi:DNA repair protein RadC
MIETSQQIKKWPKKERPRERLLQYGADSLAEAELLGILIGKGTRNKTAIDVARQLLDRYESLQELFARSPSELMKIKGHWVCESAILSAAFELVSAFSPGVPTASEKTNVQAIGGRGQLLPSPHEGPEKRSLQGSSSQSSESFNQGGYRF